MTPPRINTGFCAICRAYGRVVETLRGIHMVPARRTCLACVEVCVDLAYDRLAGAMLAEQERVREAA